MPHIKPRSLNSQHGTGYHASFLGIAGEALTANDIVIANGYSGDRIQFVKADANAAGLTNGVMGIADHTTASGSSVRVVSHKLITSVDSSAATGVGYPVYLSITPGGWTTSAAGPVVGSVVADHASTGAVLLSVAHTGSDGLESVSYGAGTSMVGSSTFDIEITLTQPPGTLLVDVGCVATTATVGTANIVNRVGTASDGQEICADANFVTSGVAAIGTTIQVASAAQGEGAASMTFVAAAPLHTATERTLYFRLQCSASITAGVVRPFIRYIHI